MSKQKLLDLKVIFFLRIEEFNKSSTNPQSILLEKDSPLLTSAACRQQLGAVSWLFFMHPRHNGGHHALNTWVGLTHLIRSGFYLSHYFWQCFSRPATTFVGLCCSTTQAILSRATWLSFCSRGPFPLLFWLNSSQPFPSLLRREQTQPSQLTRSCSRHQTPWWLRTLSSWAARAVSSNH